MKKINARFKSKCAETLKAIAKGELMIYDYQAKICYSMGSKKAIEFEGKKSNDNMGAYIAAQEDAFFDNLFVSNRM